MNSILLTILLKELQVLKTSNVKIVIFNYVRIAACILVKVYIYIYQPKNMYTFTYTWILLEFYHL